MDGELLVFLGVWLLYFFTPCVTSLAKSADIRTAMEVFVSLSFTHQLVTQFAVAQSWYPGQTVGPLLSAALVCTRVG